MLDSTLAPDFKSDLGTNPEPTRKRHANLNDHRNDERNEVSRGPVTRDDITLLCAPQDKIEFSLNEDGDAVITQSCWPDEDQTILISQANIPEFIDRLTDALGIPAFGGPVR